MNEPTYTARQLVEAMPRAFVPARAQGVKAVIQYHLTGEGGGEWIITIADGQCTVVEGTATQPALTLTMAAQDFVDMVMGKLSAPEAFMTGKLKLSGDFGLATRLPDFFQVER